MFILDYYNYVRHLPVHLNEMANIHKTHPAAYEELLQGKWEKKKKKKENFQNLHSTTTINK